jgi:hypothetical protein
MEKYNITKYSKYGSQPPAKILAPMYKNIFPVYMGFLINEYGPLVISFSDTISLARLDTPIYPTLMILNNSPNAIKSTPKIIRSVRGFARITPAIKKGTGVYPRYL